MSKVELYYDDDIFPKTLYGECMRCGRNFSLWDKLTFNIVKHELGKAHRRHCSYYDD